MIYSSQLYILTPRTKQVRTIPAWHVSSVTAAFWQANVSIELTKDHCDIVQHHSAACAAVDSYIC